MGMSEKTIDRIYWGSTVLFVLVMAFSASQELQHAPDLVEAVEYLGFPTYVLTMLGFAKLLGIPVLLAPRWPHLKEWAYAGYAFDLGGGFIAHLITGDTLERTLPSVVCLVILCVAYVSYRSRGSRRRQAL